MSFFSFLKKDQIEEPSIPPVCMSNIKFFRQEGVLSENDLNAFLSICQLSKKQQKAFRSLSMKPLLLAVLEKENYDEDLQCYALFWSSQNKNLYEISAYPESRSSAGFSESYPSEPSFRKTTLLGLDYRLKHDAFGYSDNPLKNFAIPLQTIIDHLQLSAVLSEQKQKNSPKPLKRKM